MKLEHSFLYIHLQTLLHLTKYIIDSLHYLAHIEATSTFIFIFSAWCMNKHWLLLGGVIGKYPASACNVRNQENIRVIILTYSFFTFVFHILSFLEGGSIEPYEMVHRETGN